MEFHPELGGSCANNDCLYPQNRTNSPRVDKAPSLRSQLPALADDCWTFAGGADYGANAGHATSVASIAAGATFGVASDATLVDTRAFRCDAYSQADWIVTALNWIPTDPAAGPARKVVNCSFSYLGQGNAINSTVNSLASQNILVVSAAGNDASNTFWYSPAFADQSVTVAGTDKNSDTEWYWSNYGRIDFYAPAQFIESAHIVVRGIQDPRQANLPILYDRDRYRSEAYNCAITNDTCTSGTSFAAPLVTGAVARYLHINSTANRQAAVTYLNNQTTVHTGITVYSIRSGSAPLINMNDCP